MHVRTTADIELVTKTLQRDLKANKKNIKVNIVRGKNTRKNEQNALYWVWLNYLEQETGTPAADIHLYVKNVIIGFKYKEIFGLNVQEYITTTDLSPKEFSKYLSEFESWAHSFFGYTMPRPNQYNYAMFGE